MRRTSKRIVLLAGLMTVVLLAISKSPVFAVTWTGGDFTWTNPDNDSFGAVYNDGSPADFLGAGTGTITVDAGGVNPTITTVNAAAASDYTFQGGAISGVLTKAGGNTLTLRAANSFSSVDISGGTINYDDNDRLGAGTLNFSGNSRLLLFKPGSSDTIPNAITVANDVTALLQNEAAGTTAFTGVISGGTLANPVRVSFSNRLASGATGGFHQMTLNAANSFVGELDLQDRATLNYTVDGIFGAAANSVRMSGTVANSIPQIRLLGNTLSRDINLTNSHGMFSSGTLSGILSGTNGIRVQGGTVTLSNPANTFSGSIELNTGTLEVSDPGALGSTSITFVNWQRGFKITGTPAGAFSNNIANSSNTGHVDPDAIITVDNPAAVIDWTGNLSGTANTNVTNGSRTFVKRGPGTFNISNISFTGATDVEAGTWNINDLTTGNQQDYLVFAGATLGGNGVINLASGAAVTVNGNIAPGMSAGLLTLDGNAGETVIAFNAASTLLWELDALADDNTGTAGVEFDQLFIRAGNVVIDPSAKVELSFGSGLGPDEGDAFWGEDHIWTILSYAGAAPSSDLFGSLVNGTFDRGEFELFNISGNIQLLFTTQVPEPSTATLLLMGGAFFAARRRRALSKTRS